MISRGIVPTPAALRLLCGRRGWLQIVEAALVSAAETRPLRRGARLITLPRRNQNTEPPDLGYKLRHVRLSEFFHCALGRYLRRLARKWTSAVPRSP
jgi:hypothetical protein